MSKERYLLKQIQQFLQCDCIDTYNFAIDIEELLSQPEQDLREDLRDHFAGLTMQSLINVYVNTGNETPDNEYLSGWAYQISDSMLKARLVDNSITVI